MRQRRLHGDGSVPWRDEIHHRRLRVRALPMCDGLAVAEPNGLPTWSMIAPACVAVPMVVAPAVPTLAIVAVSRFVPASMRRVAPASKPSTYATLMLAGAGGCRCCQGRLQARSQSPRSWSRCRGRQGTALRWCSKPRPERPGRIPRRPHPERLQSTRLCLRRKRPGSPRRPRDR